MLKNEVQIMKPADRQKICPNCDGKVAYDTTQCPYCFATLRMENSPSPKSPPPQDSFSALYTPPYNTSKPAEAISPLYSEKEASHEAANAQSFWPILALTVGGNLLTLSILQLFFSDHGVVRLEINGSYWFLMLLVSLPLFYLGWKNLSKD